MQQSSSWKGNRSSQCLEIPRILWNPGGSLQHLQEPDTFLYPEPDKSNHCTRIPLFYVVPNEKSVYDALWDVTQNIKFLRRRIVITSPNNQAEGPPLIGCPRLLIQYIRSYPPHLEDVPPARTWRSTMLWWLDHIYRGLVDATGSKIIWNWELWWSTQFSDEYGAKCGLMFEGEDGKWNILNNNNNLLQLGCYPVAVVILQVYKTWNWLLINLSREGCMRSM